MTSYRRSTLLPGTAVLAGETSGAYDTGGPDDHDRDDRNRDNRAGDRTGDDRRSDRDPADPGFDPADPGPAAESPLERLAERLDAVERAKRRALDAFRDVAAWGGTAQTTGYTQSEWLALVGRVPGREQWKYELLARRLPGLPVTAALFESGQLTFDQAVTIVAGTKRLSGDTLADVEQAAAEAAVGRNRRGDDPDVDGDVEQLVQRTRDGAGQDRRDRGRLDRNTVRVQPNLFGAGRITEEWADPEGFQTRLAAIEHAAGPPAPDTPRGAQLAEGSLATARAWLAGRTTHPLFGTTDAPATPDTAREADDTVDTTVLDRLDPPGLPGSPDRTALPTSPLPGVSLPASLDDVDLGPSAARPTLVVRIDVGDLDGIDPHDPTTLRKLAVGSDAAFGRLVAAGRLSSAPWLGRQLLDTLACNADLLVAVVDGERPLAEFRRPSRLPERIRRQVLWRDLGCRWPGCSAPVAHCDVHHLDEDASNHDVDNLLSLCRRHHRRLHSSFWHWRLDGTTGRFDLLRTPDGQPIHTTYPRGTDPRRIAALIAAAVGTSGGDPPGVP